MLYKCLIKPILTYTSETWTLAQTDAEILRMFERKVLISILGEFR